MNREKIISIGVLVLVVVAVGSYAVFSKPKVEKQAEVAKVESVATVNGVEIPKTTFDSQLATVIATYKTQGVNTDDATTTQQIRAQVLDDLINNELVAQGINKTGIQVTPEQIEAQRAALVTQLGGEDKLKAQIEASKITDAQLRENIAKQLAIQAYLLKNIDVSSAIATDVEIEQVYKDGIKDQKTPPKLKDVKEQIRQQIVNQKQQILVNAFIQKLRAESKIEKKAI